MVLDILRNRYLEGQITKYITRWRLKNGLEDLKKAAHYADKLLEVAKRFAPVESPASKARQVLVEAYMGNYFLANSSMDLKDQEITLRVVHWRCEADVEEVRKLIAEQLQRETERAGEPSAAYVDQG